MPSFRFLQNYSLNNLGSIWYCLIATCVQIYIITRSIYRFTAYVALPWPNSQPPTNSIHSYMLFIGCSIIILPFFIVVSLMKVGNYSNDGRKVGLFNIRKHAVPDLIEAGEDETDQDESCTDGRWLRAMWKHSLPTAPLLHLLISFCFLFPRLITEAQLIRHGFLSKADIWKTDLDEWIFDKLNGHQFSFFGLLRTINQSEHQALFSESATLGQYFIRTSKTLSKSFYELDESGHISLEFANLVGALLVLTVRYPSVFWRANKCFSLIFTAHLALNLVQSVLAYAAFQVAFKIFICDPTHLLIRFRDSSSLTLVQLTIFFFLYLLVLHLSSLSVHVYGIQKYREYRYARTKYLQSKYESKPWHSYLSYLLAMIFFLALSFLVGPLFFEFVLIYCGSLSISALLVILSTIVYFTCWIILWVCLAIKTNWTFSFDDFESNDFLLNKAVMHSPELVIINGGKVYRVKEDIAKQAIVNFVQTTVPTTQAVEENCSNLYRSQHNRMSIKSAKSERPYSRSFSKANKCRHSTRSYHKSSGKLAYEYQDGTDSEGEYTTFRQLRPISSFRQKNIATMPKEAAVSTGEQFAVNMCPTNYSLVDEEPTYGFNFMFNPLMTATETEPSSPTLGNDKGSDTSSGIHSDTSNNLSEGLSGYDKTKSNSLESLMQTLQKLEAAAADKPNLRSLSSLQRSIDILNTMDSTTEKPKPSRVRLTSFSSSGEHNTYDCRMKGDSNQSKLIEFTQNPDYTRWMSIGATVGPNASMTH